MLRPRNYFHLLLCFVRSQHYLRIDRLEKVRCKLSTEQHQRQNYSTPLGSSLPAVIFFGFLLRLVIVTIGIGRRGAILNDVRGKRVDLRQ